MKILRNRSFILLNCVLIVLGVFFLYEGWHIILRFFDIIKRYQWVGVGIAAYILFYYLINKYKKPEDTINSNLDFMEVFSHELTHAIVAILCWRKILSFHAERKNGVVWMTGGKWAEGIITLSPYCMPIFTMIMLFLWSLVATRSLVANEGLMAFDIIIGLTIAFHVLCFYDQTGDFQTDIKQFPKFFAYSFIWILRLMNLLIIILCYVPNRHTGQPLKVWGAFWYLICQLWNDILSIF